ncbi:MAG: histidine phosphatase family protein [Planctomycetia bacterium]|nr:histidine phosphatase family protein [Planctomycetia bacterium]
MQTQLIIIRHGNTFQKGDPLLRIGAGTDLPLTEEGLQQACRVGKYLCSHGYLPSIIFSSPLRRTMQTSFEIRHQLDPSIPVEPLEFLREIHYGEDDGLPEEDVLTRMGTRLLGEQETHTEILQDAGRRALERWNTELIPPPGWSIDTSKIIRQWQSFGNEILTKYPGQTVLAVTSNGIARFVWGLLSAEMAQDIGKDRKLATGAFSIFTHMGTAWRCETWNLRPESSSELLMATSYAPPN